MSDGLQGSQRVAGGRGVHELDGQLLTRNELRDELESRFRPLRPASTPKLILAAIFGPIVWAVCVLLAVVLIHPTQQVVEGALVALFSLIFAGTVLLLLRRGRIHEERRYDERT